MMAWTASRRRPVAVVVLEPHNGVVHEERAHLLAGRPVEVDGLTPGGGVAVGEIRAVAPQVVPGRAQVVVDDVHHDAEPSTVARVHQPLQAVGAAVGMMGGVEVHAVIAPAA